jgi:hypothetical protein
MLNGAMVVELKEAVGYSHQQHGERVLRRRNAVSQCALDCVPQADVGLR